MRHVKCYQIMPQQKGGSLGEVIKPFQGFPQISLSVHTGLACFPMDTGKSVNAPAIPADFKING